MTRSILDKHVSKARPALNGGRILLISAAAGFFLWTLFSWPLPRHMFSGIPSLAHPGSVDIQVMTPGDHLQFLYHCWLAGDMMAGKTPLFHNLYEFNTGDDAQRFNLDSYYMPFSLIYAIGSAIAGRAFGWNMTGLITIWLTFLLTWLLARRYTANEFVAAISSAVAVTLPYRWICLLGGSPTGFAMMWVPMIWLGMDMAVRDARTGGGFMAGIAILFSCWTDMHVFFFSVLMLPVWFLLAMLKRGGWKEIRGKTFIALLRPLLPIIAFTVFAILFQDITTWLTRIYAGLTPESEMLGKRTLQEVSLYSPGWQGLFAWNIAGLWGEIYVGLSVLLIIAAGAAIMTAQALINKGKTWRPVLILIFLVTGIAVIAALAMGTQGPCNALFLRAGRKLVPPYAMIRQPVKIFCLMPSFLALAVAISLSAIAGTNRIKALNFLLPVLCVLMITAEYALRFYPHICVLEKKQDAYAAVAGMAAERDAAPRALVVPLWSGDSHYSSVYQYFASLYRIRMINGYTPLVIRDYFENVFLRFMSVNQGDLSDEQIDELREMGIEAVLLHEDLFPESVSPFPVTFTLRQLLNHPRLSLLKQDGPVWAFELLPDAVNKQDIANWDMFGSARIWEAESGHMENTAVVHDQYAGGNGFARLSKPGAWVRTGGEYLGRAPDMKWMIRARGEGTLRASSLWEVRPDETIELRVQTPDWTWLTVPIENHAAYEKVALELEREDGMIDVDTILIAAGRWESPGPGDVLNVPAPAFFHAGYIDLQRNTVFFPKDRHANVFVFYGPKLPLDKGVYEIEIVFQTNAASGTPLGWFNLRRRSEEPEKQNEVRAGERAIAVLEHTENLRVNLEFAFFRNADMEIESVVFRRLDTSP